MIGFNLRERKTRGEEGDKSVPIGSVILTAVTGMQRLGADDLFSGHVHSPRLHLWADRGIIRIEAQYFLQRAVLVFDPDRSVLLAVLPWTWY